MLSLQARLMATFTTVSDAMRERVHSARRRDREAGVTTLEYVVIAGILFIAALGLAGWIASVISNRQSQIN